ncbi:MAG: hypothetical protein ISQ73_05700 [Verrucomicrobiae bacterium]|nr:hypothetical protein [Verrucomicrobiae bacterium]
MADKTPEKETKETKKPAGLVGLVVPLIIVLVLMPTVAYLTTEYFLADKLAEKIAKNLDGVEYVEPPGDGEDKEKTEPKKDKKGNVIIAKDDFEVKGQMVTVKNTNGSKNFFFSYLIVGKESGGLGTKIEESKKYQAQCREAAGNIIGEIGLTERELPSTKSNVKTQMISRFEDILGDDTVEDVVLEGWTVQ